MKLKFQIVITVFQSLCRSLLKYLLYYLFTYANPYHWRCVFLQVWFSNRRARLRKQMSSNTGSSTPGSGGYGMGLALGYSPSAQQQQNQQQQSSGPNSSSTPAYIMSPQQLHEPYNTTPDGYKGTRDHVIHIIHCFKIYFCLFHLSNLRSILRTEKLSKIIKKSTYSLLHPFKNALNELKN